MWSKCLLGHCYGLWFIYLPTFVRAEAAKVPALHAAFDLLKHMETRKVVLPDEVRGPKALTRVEKPLLDYGFIVKMFRTCRPLSGRITKTKGFPS